MEKIRSGPHCHPFCGLSLQKLTSCIAVFHTIVNGLFLGLAFINIFALGYSTFYNLARNYNLSGDENENYFLTDSNSYETIEENSTVIVPVNALDKSLNFKEIFPTRFGTKFAATLLGQIIFMFVWLIYLMSSVKLWKGATQRNWRKCTFWQVSQCIYIALSVTLFVVSFLYVSNVTRTCKILLPFSIYVNCHFLWIVSAFVNKLKNEEMETVKSESNYSYDTKV